MLSTGPTPNVDEGRWSFTITTEDEVTHRWNWGELQEVGVEDVVTDIHCVTHWSKLDMAWRGVPMDRLFEDVETSYDYVMVRSYGGYTTNLPLEDLLDGQAWLATEAEGEPLTPEHGGPARLLVPHLYFWKEREVGSRNGNDALGRPGVLGTERLPPPWRPMARGTLLVMTLAESGGTSGGCSVGSLRPRRPSALSWMFRPGLETSPELISTSGSRHRTGTRRPGLTRWRPRVSRHGLYW